MWKLLIADDEPKIRHGLRNIFNWNELDIEVVGEAEDGEMAFEMAERLKPDILLVDICMPFLNGLKFIEKINNILKDSIIIVVTGHDEFDYAQQAVKLQVFDYLLKPVVRLQLLSVIERAKEKLTIIHTNNKYLSWATKQLEKNMSFLKGNFLNEWMEGHLSDIEVEEQFKFFNLNFHENSGMIIVKVVDKVKKGELLKEGDRQIFLFAVQNIIEEFLEDFKPSTIFREKNDNIVAITPIRELSKWCRLGASIEKAAEENLGETVIISQREIKGGFLNAPLTYEKLISEVSEKGSCAPIVLLAKSFIEANYFNEDISLQDIADKMQISPTYLSRLLKKEVGLSFVDYLMQVRIKRAIQIMNDPMVKIYEIANSVGFKNQHYFSTAFKKILGVSPMEYRRGVKDA